MQPGDKKVGTRSLCEWQEEEISSKLSVSASALDARTAFVSYLASEGAPFTQNILTETSSRPCFSPDNGRRYLTRDECDLLVVCDYSDIEVEVRREELTMNRGRDAAHHWSARRWSIFGPEIKYFLQHHRLNTVLRYLTPQLHFSCSSATPTCIKFARQYAE